MEEAIRQKFLPAVLDHSPTDLERELFSLPTRFGGLDIIDPTKFCDDFSSHSEELTQPLVELILDQVIDYDPDDLHDLQKTILRDQKTKGNDVFKQRLLALKDKASAPLKRLMESNDKKRSFKLVNCNASP